MEDMDTTIQSPKTVRMSNLVIVFRVILLVSMVISFLGGVAGKPDEKKSCICLFGYSGALFLLNIAVEKLL